MIFFFAFLRPYLALDFLGVDKNCFLFLVQTTRRAIGTVIELSASTEP